MLTPAPDNVIELLQQMVRIDSVNGAISGRPDAEMELALHLEALADRWGLDTRRLPVKGACHNLLICCEVDPTRPWLLFDSHMDTVSPRGMTIDPFGAEIRGDRLYGRGACDTKGTGAAMLWALRNYAQFQPIKQPNNIALLFTIDEEISMKGIRAFIDQQLPQLPFAPAGVIVGEPTNLRPLTAHNGVLGMKLITTGVAGHSAAPQLGRNAIAMMLPIASMLQQQYIPSLEDIKHPLTGGATCAITTIQGGTQVNIIPDRCELSINRRLAPQEDPAEAQAQLEAMVKEVLDAHPDTELTTETHQVVPALDDAINKALQPTVAAALEACELPTAPFGAPFATHAGPLSKANLPAIVIGPGDPTPAHTKDEYVEIDQIQKGTNFYATLMGTVAAVNQ
jgi:acetylornithine deacetylase